MAVKPMFREPFQAIGRQLLANCDFGKLRGLRRISPFSTVVNSGAVRRAPSGAVRLAREQIR